MNPYRLLPAAALVLLAACGEGDTPQEGRLQGEVLEGTISDQMVPLDEVRSQAPLAAETVETIDSSRIENDSTSAARTSEEADDLDAAQPTPAPVETPVTTTDGQTG